MVSQQFICLIFVCEQPFWGLIGSFLKEVELQKRLPYLPGTLFWRAMCPESSKKNFFLITYPGTLPCLGRQCGGDQKQMYFFAQLKIANLDFNIFWGNFFLLHLLNTKKPTKLASNPSYLLSDNWAWEETSKAEGSNNEAKYIWLCIVACADINPSSWQNYSWKNNKIRNIISSKALEKWNTDIFLWSTHFYSKLESDGAIEHVEHWRRVGIDLQDQCSKGWINLTNLK